MQNKLVVEVKRPEKTAHKVIMKKLSDHQFVSAIFLAVKMDKLFKLAIISKQLNMVIQIIDKEDHIHKVKSCMKQKDDKKFIVI